MKKRDLEKELRKCGWWYLRDGGNHEIWTNGDMKESIARHREIPETTAKMILKRVRANKV